MERTVKLMNRRLLVANAGSELDPHLIRYASLVANLCGPLPTDGRAESPTTVVAHHRQARPRRTKTASRLATQPSPCRVNDVEVRFLALGPKSEEYDQAEAARLARLEFRSYVHQHFRAADEAMVIGYDVLRSKTPRRLLSYMTDYDGDLLLIGREGWKHQQLARLVMASPHAVWAVPSGWAPVLRRILVPIDFNSRAVHSVRAAINLARKYPTAKCVVLHVDRQDTRYSGHEIAPARFRELLAAYKEIMHAVDTAGVRVAPIFVKGQSVERSIAQAVNEHSPDLVVMSTRGRSRLAGAIHSSVAAATIGAVPSAVLMLKPDGVSLGWRDSLREHWRRADGPHFS